MPTYAFTRTREQLCVMVLRKLRVLNTNDGPDPNDAEVVYEAMDLRLKELHARGVLWFNVSDAQTDLALTTDTATATAPTDLLFPVTVALRINGDDVPLEIVSHREFQAIGTKTDAGEPEKVHFSGGVLRFWPVPDSAYTVKLTYEQIAADTAFGTAPDIQVSMLRALKDILAYDLGDDFKCAENLISRWRIESIEAMKTILALNQERVDTTTVTPEYF